tara:strand:- start:313 stop:441 length:129 start_codon:yes stop_codon:yes gene_type:complete
MCNEESPDSKEHLTRGNAGCSNVTASAAENIPPYFGMVRVKR